MSHDGTSHTDSPAQDPFTILDEWIGVFEKNVIRPAYSRDVFNLGDAVRDCLDANSESIETIEEEIDEIEEELTEIDKLKDRVDELEEIVSLLIFNLEEVGIPINFEKLIEYRKEYLNL